MSPGGQFFMAPNKLLNTGTGLVGVAADSFWPD